MRYEPHEYQRYATRYIEEHPCSAVLLDMGLGKTSITLTAILYFFTGDEDSVSTENAIAYFSSGKLYVNTVQILTGMRIGPFAWMPESDNLNFKLLE